MHRNAKTYVETEFGNAALEECIRTCQSLSRCTHFNWELDNEKNVTVCKLMNGTVSKTEAYHTTSPNIVCGIKDNKRIDPNELPKIGKILLI